MKNLTLNKLESLLGEYQPCIVFVDLTMLSPYCQDQYGIISRNYYLFLSDITCMK